MGGRLATVVLCLGLAAIALPAYAGIDVLTCDGLSPLSNTCTDGPRTLRTREPILTLDILGFVGHLEVELKDLDEGGKLLWECDVLGASIAGISPSCKTSQQGEVERGNPVLLFCKAKGSNPANEPVGIGPDGPWTCTVSTSD